MDDFVRMRVDLDVGFAVGSLASVVVGDRVVPETIEVHFEGVEGMPELDMVIDSRGGAPRCVSLTIKSVESGREVRSTDARAVQIDAWIEQIVPLFAGEYQDDGSAVYRGNTAEQQRAARRALNAARKSQRRKVNDDLLGKVAEVYRGAEAPRDLAVQRAFGVSESTSFRYIREARKRGLLEEN